MHVLYGGSVLKRLALRRPSDKSPLGLWLGHLLGAAFGSRVQVCRGSKGAIRPHLCNSRPSCIALLHGLPHLPWGLPQ